MTNIFSQKLLCVLKNQNFMLILKPQKVQTQMLAREKCKIFNVYNSGQKSVSLFVINYCKLVTCKFIPKNEKKSLEKVSFN
jgi:hypothetical protein